MKRIIWLISVMFLFSLIIASCTSNQPAPAGATYISVGTDATVPPFENFNAKTQQIEGFDIEIMNAIAIRENFNVDYKNVSFGHLMTDMAQGKYDASISSIIINDEHKGDMLFSNPYFAAGQIIVVRADDNTITGKDTLTGPVGVQAGTTGEIEVKKIKSAVAQPYDKISLAFVDLVTEHLNAVVCSNWVALQYVHNNPDKFKLAGKVFTDESYGIAVAKGKTDLLGKINAGIKAIKSEGLIDQFSEKWFR